MSTYSTASTLYVSVNGNDQFSGLSPVITKNDGPLKTLQRAVMLVGHMRKIGIRQPYTIRIMDDVTELPATLVFDGNGEPIHGTAAPASVAIEPFGNKRVMLSGGTAVTGFVSDTFNGVPCYSAVLPESCKNVAFTEFYVNGDRATPNRYPAEGFFVPEEVHNHGTCLHASSDWIIAKEGDLPELPHPEDVTVSFGHYWIDEHTTIKSYDPATRKLEFAAATRFTIAPECGAAAAMQYYLENVASDFGKTPGSWYFDRDENKIYYYPKATDPKAEETTGVLPRLDKLVSVVGTPDAPAQDVVFRNICFAYTNGNYMSYGYPETHQTGVAGGTGLSWYPDGKAYASDLQSCSDMHGAVEFSYAENCGVYNCEFTCLGNHGVNFKYGARHNYVSDSHFHILGAGGVRIAGDGKEDPAKATYGNTVINCEIADGGRRYLAACGIVIIHSAENRISHCTIHDFYYSGISCGWVWGYIDSPTHHNVLEKNHIYNLGKGLLSDMGGIYLLGHQKGTQVYNNVIHNVKCKVYGGWGLYTDEGSSFIRVENNIVYNCSTNCYHQHYGSYNRLANNIFGYCEDTPIIIGRRDRDHISMLLENNIILSHGNGNYRDGNPANFTSDYNVFFNTEANDQNESVYNLFDDVQTKIGERVDVFGMDKHSITVNPGFRDAANGDFTMPDDSPAYAVGFRKIDTSDVGCTWDPIRKA